MNPNPDFIIEYPPSPNRNRVGHKPTNMAQLYTKKRYSACRETADGLREVLPEYNQPTTRRLTFPVKDYNKMIQHWTVQYTTNGKNDCQLHKITTEN